MKDMHILSIATLIREILIQSLNKEVRYYKSLSCKYLIHIIIIRKIMLLEKFTRGVHKHNHIYVHSINNAVRASNQ